MELIKLVKTGIYDKVPTGETVGNVRQFKHIKIGEKETKYIYELVDDSTLKINGKAYAVTDCGQWAIKIMETHVKASGGASGLLKFLMDENLDFYEKNIIATTKEK